MGRWTFCESSISCNELGEECKVLGNMCYGKPVDKLP